MSSKLLPWKQSASNSIGTHATLDVNYARSTTSGVTPWQISRSRALKLALSCSIVTPALILIARARSSNRKRRRLCRHASSEEGASSPISEQQITLPPDFEVPENLYDLLGVSPTAGSAEIKSAYYDKMKICHPDIAGDDGEEMCILLNDAYAVLSNPKDKEAYDEQAQIVIANPAGAVPFVAQTADMQPTWEWTAKCGNRKEKPVWTGRPLSRSLHDRRKASEVGQKWATNQFVFVDEFSCIACRNCCDVAPQTFCVDADAGRARVFAQWGNSEEFLDYAVSSCPVDCIYWVNREELQILEFVTRDKLYESGNSLPCSMANRQGTGNGIQDDPFQLAAAWIREQEEKRRRRKYANGDDSGSSGFLKEAAKFRERIRKSFTSLKESLRKSGWG